MVPVVSVVGKENVVVDCVSYVYAHTNVVVIVVIVWSRN